MLLTPTLEYWAMTDLPLPTWRLRWFIECGEGIRKYSGWSPGTWPSFTEELSNHVQLAQFIGIEGEHNETKEIAVFVRCPIAQFHRLEYHGLHTGKGISLPVAGISISTKDKARFVVFINGYIHEEGLRNG